MSGNIIPDELERLIAGKPYVVDSIGLSWAEVRLYDEYVLKIRQPSAHADNEAKILAWLNGRENTPRHTGVEP